MDDIEKKLLLIKQLKEEQLQNKERMLKRNKIVSLPYTNDKITPDTPKPILFYIRIGICVGVFLCFCYLKENNADIYGLKATHISKIISQKADVNSFAFLQNLPYTLEE